MFNFGEYNSRDGVGSGEMGAERDRKGRELIIFNRYNKRCLSQTPLAPSIGIHR